MAIGGHALLLAITFWLCPGPVLAQSASSDKPTLYYIPHTHWEAAVFKTREAYLPDGFANILQALRLLRQFPDYKFTLDQAAYVKPFLERYPEEAAQFRQYVQQGRLGIVGGMDVMPDDVKPGGELFVRQVQYGKRYFRQALGVEVKAAWLIDSFGHHAQLPQLLRLAGFDSFWFSRGVPTEKMPSEFRWRGLDGTEIQTIWLPGFYGLFYGPPRQFAEFEKFFRHRFDSLSPHVTAHERVGLAGADVSLPEDYVPPLVAQFNRQPDGPFTIRYAVPDEFAAVVARRRDLSVVTNDLNPIFQGTYSSRIELKQLTRRLEERLLTAEKLSALAQCLGAPADEAALWRAWEPVLFNQTHDLASGIMTDRVYEDTVESYHYSQRLADEIVQSRWHNFVSHIDTRGEGNPVVVFNPLGWPRTDVAELEVGFDQIGIGGVRLIGTDGETVPVQIAEAERYGDGGLKRAHLAFVAREVPAIGYATYWIDAQIGPNAASQEATPDAKQDSMENEYCRVTLNLSTGEMTALQDKMLGWQALHGAANVVARQDDHGDLWELYHGLDGASHIAMTNRQAVPGPSSAHLSSQFSAKPGSIRRGPVFSEFRVAHPLVNGTFATRVRLYSGMRRIDIRTELVNQEKYVRYQVLFPTSIRAGHYVQEIPFGCLVRADGIEFPAQNWVDYSDGEHGLALLNIGLPGNLETDGTLLLSLMRSHNLGQYGYGGGYEPGMSSETGFELGRQLTFDYALVPHAGDWRQGAVYRAGLEFNQPLLVFKTTPRAGDLPKRWGLLDISASNVVLSACTPSGDHSVAVRLYEAAGLATPALKLNFNLPIAAVREANLMEDSGRVIRTSGNAVEIDLRPFEVRTIKVYLR